MPHNLSEGFIAESAETLDDMIVALKSGITALDEIDEPVRAARLNDLKGSLIAYGIANCTLADRQKMDDLLADCIRALRAHSLMETAGGLAGARMYLLFPTKESQATLPSDYAVVGHKGETAGSVGPTMLGPLEGAQRTQEVDSVVAKNLQHLESARSSLHRVTFVGIGPDGMRSVCDMLDGISRMIKDLTPEE